MTSANGELSAPIVAAFERHHQAGRNEEQARILKLLKSFWCGEPGCEKHPVRMDWVIYAIQDKANES